MIAIINAMFPFICVISNVCKSVSLSTELDLSSLQLHTSVKLTSGSVQISAVSLSHGSAMVRTTVVISLTRTLPTAPPGPVVPDSSNAAMDAASPRAGNVMLMMTVVITQMNR